MLKIFLKALLKKTNKQINKNRIKNNQNKFQKIKKNNSSIKNKKP